MVSKQSFRPTLLVGVGGTGSAIAQNVYRRAARAELFANGRVRVLAFDTDENDTRKLAGLGPDQKIRFSVARTMDDLLDQYPEVEARWFVRPRSELPMELRKMTLLEGAGQVRMLSRLALHDAYARGQIESTLGAALSALGQYDNREGFEGQVNVLMVGSLAGATGSGSFLQIAALINDTARQRNIETNVYGLFMMPDIYVRSGALPQGQIANVLANGYASLKEFHAVTLKATERQGRFDFDFEFAPGKFLSAGEIPLSSVTLIDYEDIKGGNLGRSIPAYRRLAERAAFTLLFTPVGGKAESVMTNDIRQTLGAAARGTHNRIAAIGLSAVEYPHEDIVAYLRDRLAMNVLVGDWLRLDRQFETRLRRFRDQRAAGNMTVEEPEQGKSYLDDLRQLALDDQVPFFREIYERLNPAVTEPGGERTVTPLHESFLRAVDDQQVRTFWNADDLKVIATRGNADADIFSSETALTEEVRRHENRLDGDFRQIEAALVSRPNDIVVNMLSLADDMSEAEWRGYHIQTYLVRSGPHLVQSRAFLYMLRQHIEDQLSSISADEIRKRLFRLANAFDSDRGNDPDVRSTPKILEEANGILRRGFVGRLVKGGKDDFVDGYVGYYNSSLRVMRRYAEARLREKAYRLLIAEVDELIRVTNGLFKEIRSIMKSLETRVSEAESKHVGSDVTENTRFVLADGASKRSLWEEVEIAAAGQRLGETVNARIAAELYRVARRNRGQKDDSGLQQLRNLFMETVVDDFARNRVLNDYSSIHDLSVVEAIRKQAAVEKITDVAALLREIFSVIGRQSEILMTLSTPSDGQHIQFWAFHPDLREQLATIADPDQLINPAGQGIQTIEETDFSLREILSVSLRVNLELGHLAKLSPPYKTSGSVVPDRAGRYYLEYQAMVNELIDAAADKRMPKTITPHIHRDWHKPGLLPEISEVETNRLVANINKSFAIGLAFDALNLTVSHGQRVAEVRTVNRVSSGGVSVEIANSHDLYAVLDAFERHPEAVRGCLRFWDEERQRIEGTVDDESIGRALNPAVVQRILGMAETRRDENRRDSRVADVVQGYAHLVHDLIIVSRPNIPGPVQDRETDTQMKSIGEAAMSALRDIGLANETLKVMEDCYALGLERWRAAIRAGAETPP